MKMGKVSKDQSRGEMNLFTLLLSPEGQRKGEDVVRDGQARLAASPVPCRS